MSLNQVFFTLFLVGTLSMVETKLFSKPSRTLAQVGFAGATQSEYTSRGIVDRLIQVNLSSNDVDLKSQIITAEIQVPFDNDDQLRFKWSFGENVKLIAGSQSGVIEHLKNNLPVKITIEVFGFTQDENRHIGFEIGGQRKLRIVHGESLLASRVDKTFENIVQNVERIKLEESGADHE